MAIFYIDTINGDQANDGSTPALSIVEPKEEMGSDGDIATVYIRRTSDVVLSSSTTNHYVKYVRWPEAEDDDYASRPQAGIDALWDDDASRKPTWTVNASSYHIAGPTTASINYYGIELISTENGGTETKIVYATYGLVEFEKCTFTCGGGAFRPVRIDSIDNSAQLITVKFTDCIANNRDDNGDDTNNHSIFVYHDFNTNTQNCDIQILNCQIYGWRDIFHKIVTAEYYARNTKLTISNSTINSSTGKLVSIGVYYNRQVDFLLDLTILNSTITTLRDYMIDLSGYSNSGTHISSKLNLHVIDSTLLSSDSIIRESVGSARGGGIQSFFARGTTFSAFYLYNSYHVDSYAIPPVVYIDITGCTFVSMTYLWYVRTTREHLIHADGAKFYDNTFDEVVNFMYSYNIGIVFDYIKIKGQILSGKLLIGAASAINVAIVDSVIVQKLTETPMKPTSITVISSDVDGIAGSIATMKLNGCICHAGGYIVENGAKVEAVRTQLDSSTGSLTDSLSSLHAENCNVQFQDVPEGFVEILNSTVNGNIEESYISDGLFISKFASAKFTITSESIEVLVPSSTSRDKGSVFSETGIVQYTGGNNIELNLAIKNDSATAEIDVLFQYISDGKLITANSIIENGNVWDTLDGSYLTKKATLDVSGLSITNNSYIFAIVETKIKDANTSTIIDKAIVVS